MKKSIIILLIFGILQLTACSSESSYEPTNSDNLKAYSGIHQLFTTKDRMVYLQFLDNFDYDKLEIVDITVMPESVTYRMQEHYTVTYKCK